MPSKQISMNNLICETTVDIFIMRYQEFIATRMGEPKANSKDGSSEGYYAMVSLDITRDGSLNTPHETASSEHS